MLSFKKIMMTKDQDLLTKAIQYKNQKYRVYIAQNPNISEAIMKKLMNFGSEEIAVTLASNQSITDDIANSIYETNYFMALNNLSKNKKCPIKVLDKLGNDARFYINLIDNPSTPIYTIKRILKNPNNIDFCFDIIINSVLKRTDVKDIVASYEIVLY